MFAIKIDQKSFLPLKSQVDPVKLKKSTFSSNRWFLPGTNKVKIKCTTPSKLVSTQMDKRWPQLPKAMNKK